MQQTEKFTKREALRLSGALYGQMKRRHEAMQREVAFMQGHGIKSKEFVRPPHWVIKACRISTASFAKPLPQEGQSEISANQVGAVVGIIKTWESALQNPSTEEQLLERQHPEIANFRRGISELSERAFKIGNIVETHVSESDLTAKQQLEYSKGRQTGSEVVVNDSGELRDDLSIRAEICWFIWLYWKEIKIFSTMTDLLKFLEEFQIPGITQGNLKKVCGEVGLRFKGRGRPAK